MLRLRSLTIVAMLSCCLSAAGQDDGYFMEFGLGGGGSFYMGDANTELYISMKRWPALLK